MMGSSALALLAGSFLLAVAAVYLVRRHALREQLLDIPNDRSSHTSPTPRGGGLGVVIVIGALWLAALIAWAPRWRLELTLCLCAMLAVAAVGWIDDRRGLRVGPRMAVHLVAGLSVAALSARVGWHWAAGVWWIVWVVSSINVVNFMDGIDGLIASQTVIAALSMAHLAPTGGLARSFALAIAGATGGFLCWNWPPARIFLGDVGSGALGFVLVVAGALTMAESGVDIVRAFLPLYPLFLDSAWTIVRRIRKGERVTVAHRSHLYQRLANGGWGHGRVTIAYAAAALVGAGVAWASEGSWRWLLIAVYATLVLALGRMLDRLAPFDWTAAAARSGEPEGGVALSMLEGDDPA